MQRPHADAPDTMVCDVIARFIDIGQADSKFPANPRYYASPKRCAGPVMRYHSTESKSRP
jgi:hypothetical protein